MLCPHSDARLLLVHSAGLNRLQHVGFRKVQRLEKNDYLGKVS
jgi:hypothetical protein